MTRREAINFKSLISELVPSQQAPEAQPPLMVKGVCDYDQFSAWLTELDLTKLTVRIWCYTDESVIGTEVAPRDVDRLERARLFGPGGDLEVWRGNQGFRWRYVGLAASAPEGDTLAWPDDENNPVFSREQTALFWGNRPEGRERWYDDRVAGARLEYPIGGAPERIQVRYREYTQAGRPFAIWLQELEAYHG